MKAELEHRIFNIDSEETFNSVALEVFYYQAENVPVFREYLNHLKVLPRNITSLEEIIYLPIAFFKSHFVNSQSSYDVVFKSSGTGGTRSSHFLFDQEIYKKSLLKGFTKYFSDVENKLFLGLLPNYLENGDSSLVYMVNELIKHSNKIENHFFLHDNQGLRKIIEKYSDKDIVLFGVSYALLDFIEEIGTIKNPISIIETGGMKGRKKEITKEEVLLQLSKGFPNASIYSEYGMTELLSQAYAKDNLYKCPPWMKIFYRDPHDPFVSQKNSGAINIIDLANLNSCSFIATDDLGKHNDRGGFEILGRLDQSDLRGCNLLIL